MKKSAFIALAIIISLMFASCSKEQVNPQTKVVAKDTLWRVDSIYNFYSLINPGAGENYKLNYNSDGTLNNAVSKDYTYTFAYSTNQMQLSFNSPYLKTLTIFNYSSNQQLQNVISVLNGKNVDTTYFTYNDTLVSSIKCNMGTFKLYYTKSVLDSIVLNNALGYAETYFTSNTNATNLLHNPKNAALTAMLTADMWYYNGQLFIGYIASPYQIKSFTNNNLTYDFTYSFTKNKNLQSIDIASSRGVQDFITSFITSFTYNAIVQ